MHGTLQTGLTVLACLCKWLAQKCRNAFKRRERHADALLFTKHEVYTLG